MEINVRKCSPFMEVKINFDNGVTWDSGLLNDQEITELAREFIKAADELIPA